MKHICLSCGLTIDNPDEEEQVLGFKTIRHRHRTVDACSRALDDCGSWGRGVDPVRFVDGTGGPRSR